jgi:hypothetical protein
LGGDHGGYYSCKPEREVIVAEQKTQTQTMEAEQKEGEKGEQMCCEGGMTAAEHRAQSPDGKCCTD